MMDFCKRNNNAAPKFFENRDFVDNASAHERETMPLKGTGNENISASMVVSMRAI